MADPTRLRVLKALTGVLETITPANGYAHDLTGKVFRGRDIFGYTDPLPMIAILEQIEEQEQQPSPQTSAKAHGPWTLQIQGFVADDRDNPTDPAHHLLGEVKKRLIEERIRDRQRDILGMGDVVTELRLSQGVVRPADEISDKAYFWMRITLGIVENLNEPYA
jgi:hypothetical protein